MDSPGDLLEVFRSERQLKGGGGMIIPIKEAKFVDDIIPLIEKIKMPISVPDYVAYIKSILSDDNVLLLVNINKNNVIDSFIFVETFISVGDKSREAMVDLAYVHPNSNGLGKQLQEYAERWGKLQNCKRLTMYADEKRKAAYMRKYGFNRTLVYMIKDLGGES
jgi:hypothetical protein